MIHISTVLSSLVQKQLIMRNPSSEWHFLKAEHLRQMGRYTLCVSSNMHLLLSKNESSIAFFFFFLPDVSLIWFEFVFYYFRLAKYLDLHISTVIDSILIAVYFVPRLLCQVPPPCSLCSPALIKSELINERIISHA